jgi:L-aminopeptidase/D-esterase-like protein
MTITDVPGVRVGHWTNSVAETGVSVMTFPESNVAAVEFRGAAPGSRETELLAPGMRVQAIQALVFSGGSAYGLAAAHGVMARLEAEGKGHRTMAGHIVPIVPAAIVYDLHHGDPAVRPGPAEGAAAYDALSGTEVEMGRVGAGAGISVADWRGPEAARPSGLGSASMQIDGAVIGALAVVNAGGDVFTLEGAPLTGGNPVPDVTRMRPADPLSQTTLVAVATDGAFDRPALGRLAVRAHDALGACIRPVHTRYDGDAVFVVSCGQREVSPDVAGEAAFLVVGRAIEAAVRSASKQEAG